MWDILVFIQINKKKGLKDEIRDTIIAPHYFLLYIFLEFFERKVI